MIDKADQFMQQKRWQKLGLVASTTKDKTKIQNLNQVRKKQQKNRQMQVGTADFEPITSAGLVKKRPTQNNIQAVMEEKSLNNGNSDISHLSQGISA